MVWAVEEYMEILQAGCCDYFANNDKVSRELIRHEVLASLRKAREQRMAKGLEDLPLDDSDEALDKVSNLS